jgi:uncharacterized protein YrrD
MKQILSKVIGKTVETKDGKKGTVKDFLFDEKFWIIRYLEADFGDLFTSMKVLVPKVFFSAPEWDKGRLQLELTEGEIEKCPKISEHLPVSRKYEEELYKHYDLQPYWTGAHMGPMTGFYPPRPISSPDNKVKESELDTILRSFNEVEGYHVNALDGNLGHIEDIIVNDENWQITSVVIDTKNWLPWSKKVMIAVDWIESISYVDREVKVKLSIETIKNAPEYNPNDINDMTYEISLFDYYSNSLIK